MTRRLVIWTLAALLFGVVATANSGGYRFGGSDQAFYVPAVALSANPSLFPRDRAILAPQMRMWLGDSVIGALVRAGGGNMPAVYAAMYVLTLVLLCAAAAAFARRLGASWWGMAGFVVLLTLRHRIAKTGANTLEPYMHPRMLAFAFGMFALAAFLAHRPTRAALWTVVAAVLHTTTGFWFALMLGVAAVWQHERRADLLLGAFALVAAGLALVVVGPLAPHMSMIDPAWRSVLDEKDYLYSAQWPAYAWISNFAYLAVIAAIHRRRHRLTLATRRESGLVAGLAALVVAFLISVPLTEGGYALAVQAQVNRVFWLLDTVTAAYLAWWLLDDLPARRGWSMRARAAILAVLAAIAIGRGIYVLEVESRRPLFAAGLPQDAWMDAMRWLRTQPVSWHVLADPEHGWKYGISVRVGAERDVLLEAGKDTALAIYDRDIAHQVAERRQALANFDQFTTADVRQLARRYQLDVFVDRRDRSFPLPVLFHNDAFVVYDLR